MRLLYDLSRIKAGLDSEERESPTLKAAGLDCNANETLAASEIRRDVFHSKS